MPTETFDTCPSPALALAAEDDVRKRERVIRAHSSTATADISAGIGLAIVRYLISQSHNVVILARSAEILRQLQQEHPKQVRPLAGDLADFSLADKAVGLAQKDYGRLDGLVLNHGAMFGVKSLEDCNIDDWRSMFDINLFSAVAFTKAALPPLRHSKGCIVYTSTGASTSTYSTWGPYSTSKAALNMLAKQVACEETEVTAFAIRPGMVDTEMQQSLRETHLAGMKETERAKFQNVSALLKPDQPANVMAKLAINPDMSLNGQYLRIGKISVKLFTLDAVAVSQQRIIILLALFQ
ncbi:uncharacterized protein KY384_005552 [Bacidia gigantensis]|uniref:uncharacterized protein n=1 Tax=Bacidia gigantensis TaxID=2732470 RepID=UPI001D043ECC|nr:uncharacterized protein KY384_005552 [Bacidia gigantensis]KAG8530070.1 hypothetical protein KY384_005552 [Bacidia gigantensis]